MWKTAPKTQNITEELDTNIYELEVDEEKKVEAVRDFYAQAAKNETAFSSAERMLFFGKLVFPKFAFLMRPLSFDS